LDTTIGVLLKRSGLGNVVEAVHRAARGEIFMTAAVRERTTAALRDRRRRAAPAELTEHLTAHEIDVLQLLAEECDTPRPTRNCSPGRGPTWNAMAMHERL